MALLTVTSPHMHGPTHTATIMQWVLIATIPGVTTLTWFFGWGTIVNIAFACVIALAGEALVLKWRHKTVGFYLRDCSALVTAVLLGIALPPLSPWWLILIGTLSAVVVAKQLYGGLGYNPFNPAMVGYVVLLIAFPLEMSTWLAPRGSVDSSQLPNLLDAIMALWTSYDSHRIDAITMATPLDLLKHNNRLLIEDLWVQNSQFGRWGGTGWEWVNLAFLAGGLWLLYKRVFTWHAPVCMLLTLTILSAFFYDGGSSTSAGSPLFHLLSGATMLGAFFIITDPISSAVSNKGRMIYGALIGVLLYVIRVWGNYPDAMAFAVLLMNFSAPFIDHYTQPRVYGHGSKHSSRKAGKPS